MSNEEHDRIVTKLTRSMLMDIVFDSKNALALTLITLHNVTVEELASKISDILAYLEETKEGEN